MNAAAISRSLLFALAALGTFAGARLSLEHMQHGEVCPMLGPVPACIIVFFGYLSILISAVILKNPKSKTLFYIGWTPVFALAFVGVGLELIRGETCPPSAAGIPQCFYSLAMAITAWVLFRISYRSKQKSMF